MPSGMTASAAPACVSPAFAVSNAEASAASSASQDNPARSSSRRVAPALCQTLAAMWW
jgi:hypothetical protein